MILFSDVSKIFARLSDHNEERIFLFDFQYGLLIQLQISGQRYLVELLGFITYMMVFGF